MMNRRLAMGLLSLLLLFSACSDDDSSGATGAADTDISDVGGQDQGTEDQGSTDQSGDVEQPFNPVFPDDVGTCGTDLIGTFSISNIGGAPTTDPQDSIITFQEGGTYLWCLNKAGYEIESSGNYEVRGAYLAIDGDILLLLGRDGSPVMLYDCDTDTFTFSDEDSDVWTWVRDGTLTTADCE